MALLQSLRALSSTPYARSILLLVGGAFTSACGGDGDGSDGPDGSGSGGSLNGDGDVSGVGGNSAQGGMGGEGTGGMSVLDPHATIGDTRLLECGEESEGLKAQLYTKTGWQNQTECERAFLSQWDTTKPGASTEKQLKLPLVEEGTYDFWIDWGDETLEHIEGWDASEVTHSYSESGEYGVRVVGTWVGFRFWELDPSHKDFHTEVDPNDAAKLLEISQWGGLTLGPVSGHLAEARNFQLTATDAPDLSETTSLSYAFFFAEKFNADIEHWDTSGIVDLTGTFWGASSFNQDLAGWDTSNVVSLWTTFAQATSFDGDIGAWDTSGVEDMSFTFQAAAAFNQDISGWDVSNVEKMNVMFALAKAFNQDISGWDVSNVVNMFGMFSGAEAFDQPIGKWDVSNVENMGYLLNLATSFNQDLSAWEIANVTNMATLFDDSGTSSDNYSKFLSACAAQPIQANVPLGAAGIQYSSLVAPSRKELTDPPNHWIITDGGQL